MDKDLLDSRELKQSHFKHKGTDMHLSADRLKTFLLRAIFLSALCLMMTTASANAKPPYWVYAYFNSSVDTNGAQINLSTGIPWNDITHIGDAFAIPNASAGIDLRSSRLSSTLPPAPSPATASFQVFGSTSGILAR